MVKLNKTIKLCIFVSLIFTMMLFPGHTWAGNEKSSVLLIFNNQANKYYNYKLDTIALQELHKKVDGIYTVFEDPAYTKKYSTESHYGDETKKLIALSSGVNADYIVYTELMPYQVSENFNLIWHTKKAKATVGLCIIDKQNEKEIFKDIYALEVKGSTDHFFIGNPSMLKKSLRVTMFKVCEAISFHLPL